MDIWFSCVVAPPGRAAWHQQTRLRGPPPIGLGARSRRRWPPDRRGVRRAASPTPGFGQRPPPRAPERAHCRHDAGRVRVRRRTRREIAVRRRWCSSGWPLFVVLSTSSSCSAAAPCIGRTGVTRRRALRARHRRRRAGLRARPDPARGRRLPRRCRAASPRRTTSCGGSPGPPPAASRPRSCRPGWPGCSPRAPAPSGRRCGWSVERPARPRRHLAAGRGRPALPDGADPSEADDPTRRARPVSHAASCSASSSCRSGRACRSPRSRSGCSPGWPPRPGLVLRGARLRAELEPGARRAVASRADELRRSRERLVDAQDDERRRLERDIHDGAQQHLVALAVNLRLAAHAGSPARRSAPTPCSPPRSAAAEAVDDPGPPVPRDLPAAAQRGGGLVAALRSVIARSPAGTSPSSSDGGRPLPARRSRRRRTSAAWRRCRTPPSTPGPDASAVTLIGTAAGLQLTVEDDGVGFDPATTAAGCRPGQHPRPGGVRGRVPRPVRTRSGHPARSLAGPWSPGSLAAVAVGRGGLTCSPAIAWTLAVVTGRARGRRHGDRTQAVGR